MYGAMMPSRKNRLTDTFAGQRRTSRYIAKLVLENKLSKQTVTTRTRIRHLPIRFRFHHKRLKPIPVLPLLEGSHCAKLRGAHLRFTLADHQLRRLECVALCLFSSYACCLRFSTRSRKRRQLRLRRKRLPLPPPRLQKCR